MESVDTDWAATGQNRPWSERWDYGCSLVLAVGAVCVTLGEAVHAFKTARGVGATQFGIALLWLVFAGDILGMFRRVRRGELTRQAAGNDFMWHSVLAMMIFSIIASATSFSK